MKVCGKGSEKAEEPLLTQTERQRKGENLTRGSITQEAARQGCYRTLAVHSFIELEALTSLKAAERPRL